MEAEKQVIFLNGIFAVYLVDVICVNLGGESSAVTSPILEILKSLVPLLLGYLFATESRPSS